MRHGMYSSAPLPGANSRSLPWRGTGLLCVRPLSTDHLVLPSFELKTNTPSLAVVRPARGETPGMAALALLKTNHEHPKIRRMSQAPVRPQGMAACKFPAEAGETSKAGASGLLLARSARCRQRTLPPRTEACQSEGPRTGYSTCGRNPPEINLLFQVDGSPRSTPSCR